MSYEPPTGLREFVQLLQRASTDDAVDLLRMAFDNAAAAAIVDDFRLRTAAPALLDACKRALPVYAAHGVDDTDLRVLIKRIEAAGALPAVLRLVPVDEAPHA